MSYILIKKYIKKLFIACETFGENQCLQCNEGYFEKKLSNKNKKKLIKHSNKSQ